MVLARRGVMLALTSAVLAVFGLSGCTPLATKQATTTTAYVAAQPPPPTDLGLNVTTVMDAALPAALNAYIDAKGGHSGVDVVDRVTGATVAVNASRTFQTASIVKFDILATRLYQTQQAGTGLTSHEQAEAKLMITQSDNDAASYLYSRDGQASGVTAANKVFGVTNTVPGADGAWGKTRTSPSDQVKLLAAVFKTGGVLSASNQQYMLSLMSKIESDQAWGITAAKTSASTGVYVKNGWVEMDAYGHLEGDNSIGRIVEPGHDWLIATMSNYNQTDTAGEKILEALASMAVEGLRLSTQHVSV